MKKLFLLVALIVSWGGLAGEVTAFVQAHRTRSTILLDGRLDEKAWQEAPEFNQFFKAGSHQKAACRTSLRVLYDANALYVGVYCHESRMNAVKAKERPRDGGLYENDCIEVMLDPARSRERYYQFMADIRNQQYDSFIEQGGGVTNPQWNGVWWTKAYRGKDFWSCEIKIPFFNFSEAAPLTGDWGINLCRDKRTPVREDVSISGEYHKINKFLPLRGIKVDFSALRLEVTNPQGRIHLGSNERIFVENHATIKNCSNQNFKLRADSWLISPRGEVLVSPATTVSIAAGQSVEAKLPAIEVKSQGIYRNVLRLVNAEGRPVAYREVRQRIRFSPVSIKLQVPWYRHTIFVSQKIREVEFAVHIGLEPKMLQDKILELKIGNGRQTFWQKQLAQVQQVHRFKVPNSVIDYGRHQITAVLKERSGKKVDFCTAEQRLWKLPFKANEVWCDRQGLWYIAGKPFFINSLWGRTQDELPIHNTIITYKDSWKRLVPGQWAISGTVIFYANRRPGMLKAYQSGHMEEKDLDNIRRAVRQERDVPVLFGYFLMDEPSSMSTHLDSLLQAYETIKSEDPYHPVLISDSPKNLYIEAGDINAHHPYPNVRRIKHNDCTAIAASYDAGRRKLGRNYHQTSFIFMDMGFNKWDFGLGPSDGRMATFAEFRNHMLMGLACGMKGLMPFQSNYYCYPEGTIGFPALAAEGRWLGQAVIAADWSSKITCQVPEVRFIAKNFNGGLIIASNVSTKSAQVKFSGLPLQIKALNVVGEKRRIPVLNGIFHDHFDPCQGHVYSVDPESDQITDAATIQQQIEQEWQRRAKPGNLLFQREKEGTVKVTASSIFVNYSNGGAESTLWHLCDGYLPEAGGYGLLLWSSVKNKLPAWIQFKLKRGATFIGRVVVYPIDRSVKGLEVELLINGNWKKVWSIADATALERIEAVFPPVKTDCFRIRVLSYSEQQKFDYYDRNKRARIGEVEAYRE